ncbi:MAG: DNA-binding protein [Deltaproteobacteria bacterium]|nr:DNA-binding protein [Deltaproteobacteria bacterium]
MPQSKILLDTNAYLRLAQSINPLLFEPFGEENYTLYLIDDFQKEFDRNQRLKEKFYWVNESEYVDNRKKKIKISRQDKNDINVAYSIIWEQNITMGLGASRTDVRALAFGYILNIPVVTDDNEMVVLAEAFEIEVWGIIQLMKIMYDSKHLNFKKLKAIVNYLEYNKDLPYAGFKKEFEKMFGKQISNK